MALVCLLTLSAYVSLLGLVSGSSIVGVGGRLDVGETGEECGPLLALSVEAVSADEREVVWERLEARSGKHWEEL
jgi:hypothetical protein